MKEQLFSLGGWQIAVDERGVVEARKCGARMKSALVIETDGVSPRNTKEQMRDLRLTRLHRPKRLIDAHENEGRLLVESEYEGGYAVTQAFAFTEDWAECDAILSYDGETTSVLRRLRWTVEGADADKQTHSVLYGPGTIPTMDEPIDLRRPISAYQSENLISNPALEGAPYNSSGMMGAYDERDGVAEASWFLSDLFFCETSNLLRGERLRRESEIYCPRRMRRGDSQRVGTLFLGAAKADRSEAAMRFAKSFARMGWDRTRDAHKMRDLRVMELYLGEKSGRVMFTSYKEVTDALPRIAELGFNALEIMPRMPFPSYTVFDLMNVEATYGDSLNLRELIDKAHKAGFRVLFDIVLHGPRDVGPSGPVCPISPYLNAPDEWFMKNEQGDHAHTYTRSFDLSSPGFQKHVLEVMRHYLGGWHVDGFRLDAQNWNCFPNWDENTGRMPYEPLLAGYRMMDGIRAQLDREFPEAIYYTEARAPGAAHGHEYRYNYDYHWLYPSLCNVTDPRGMCPMTYNYGSTNTMSWADAALWCHENNLISPEGLTIVQQVDSHDSCEWAGFTGGQYNREAFGDACYEVLYGMASFLGGAMMSLYGAPKGHEAYVGQIMRLRSTHPLFKDGECRLDGLTCDDKKTVAILWENGGECGAYIGNLEPREKTVRFSYKTARKPRALFDLLTGKIVCEADTLGFALTLAPHDRLVVCEMSGKA